MDAWVDQSAPATNNNSGPLTVKSRHSSNNAYAYVNFTFPAIPAGCVIQSATLNLYVSSAESGRTIQVWQVTSSWLESAITWTNQPLSTSASAASGASGTSAGPRSWTVTSIVQKMYSTGNFYGFLIRDQTDNENGNGATQVYNGKDSGTNKPMLVITFGQAP
jgi:hypothetical protein